MFCGNHIMDGDNVMLPDTMAQAAESGEPFVECPLLICLPGICKIGYTRICPVPVPNNL